MKDVIKMLEEQESELRTKLYSVRQQLKEVRMKETKLDFEGKFIKYTDIFDSTPIYMRVDWIREEPSYLDRYDYAYTFRGFGFFAEFTGYEDATRFDWDYMFEFEIKGVNEKEFDEKVKKIQVIDEKEFLSTFNLYIDAMKEYNEMKLSYYKDKENKENE